MAPVKKTEEASIVLVGSFNPKIFHPSWFELNGLLAKSDSKFFEENQEPKVISNEFCIYNLGWLTLNITHDKFVAQTNLLIHFEKLKDFVTGTFTLLEHTPILKMGFNRNFVYDLANLENRNKLGYRLVPKSNWDGIFPVYDGMKSLKVRSTRSEEVPGHTELTIGPVENSKSDVNIQVNNHFELKDTQRNCHYVVSVIREKWAPEMEVAASLADKVINLESYE